MVYIECVGPQAEQGDEIESSAHKKEPKSCFQFFLTLKHLTWNLSDFNVRGLCGINTILYILYSSLLGTNPFCIVL